MVSAVRAGRSQRSVARSFRVSLATVQFWLRRAGEERLDRVDWFDRPPVAARTGRTARELEDLILELRRDLRESSILGEYGAEAIRRELLVRQPPWPLPTARTIGRVLERRGALDAGRRVRRRPPPPGWYLPEVAARQAELDSFDIVDGLYLRGQPELGILTVISLHGGLPGAWPAFGMRVGQIIPAMTEHWRSVGRPGYAQFDNDGRFIGGLAKPDSIGPVIRLCLGLGVTPVFVPPHETGFQAAIEAFNGRWQAKLWARFWEPTLSALQARSDAYIAACRKRSAVRIESAPPRAVIPDRRIDLEAPLTGRLIFLRRTTETGSVSILGHHLRVDPHWPHRLVRAELDLDARRLQFFALRRREPSAQPLLAELPYSGRDRWFK